MLIFFGNANSRKKYIPLNTGQIRSQPVATYYSPYLHFLFFFALKGLWPFCDLMAIKFLYAGITAANFPQRRRKPFGIKRRQSCYYFEFWLSTVFIKKIQKTGFGTTEKSGERGKFLVEYAKIYRYSYMLFLHSVRI